jgi:CRISPR system Cascade subunit CasD
VPRFLLFRLYGPLASWGEVAVGEVRPSALHPTRSALLGLLAAALGLRRDAESDLAELGRTLRFAVRVESAGMPLSDYHTAQVAAPRRGRVSPTREAQLRGRRDELETILSRRDYRCDALYLVAAWHEGEAPAWDLDALAQALEHPVFALCLGRKSCPPGLPLSPRVLAAPSAAAALERVDLPLPFALPVARMRGGSRTSAGLFWEGSPEMAGLAAEQRLVRRDDPGSRRRRTYRLRSEFFTSKVHVDGKDEDGDDVPQPHQPLP